jgi:hypothetical protein
VAKRTEKKPPRVRGKRAITIFISPEDDQSIERIKERTGISTTSDAVRFAVTMLGHEPTTIRVMELEQAVATTLGDEAKNGMVKV